MKKVETKNLLKIAGVAFALYLAIHYWPNAAIIFKTAFANEMPEGNASYLYSLKIAEDTSFVTNTFCWAYMLTVLVSVASLVFAILGLLGMRFKLVNLILGIALVVLAVVTFIFAIVVAGKFDTDVLGLAGTTGKIAFGSVCIICALVAGSAQVYKTRV